MKRNIVRVVAALAILLLVFLNPAWIEFLIIGLTVRVFWSNRHTAVARGIIYFVTGLALSVVSAVGAIFVLLTILLAAVLFLNSCTTTAPGPNYESVEYRAHIAYISASNTFSVKDEVIIQSEERVNRIFRPPWAHISTHGKPVSNLEELMATKGWAYAGDIDGKPIYSRLREQKASCGWLSAYTINDISIPQVSHENMILEPNEHSKVFLDVPKHLIVSTFPSSTPQDRLKGGRELFVINVSSPVHAYPNLEMGVAHPALRNEVGASLIRTSLWTPVYWTVAALLLIFSKQIELGILMPLVGLVFKILGIKYRTEKDGSTEGAAHAKGKKRSKRANSKNKLSGRLKESFYPRSKE